jgi:hypothetical protein
MANVTTGQIWKLDTAAVIKTSPLHVKRMIWDSPTTSGHDIVVQNNAGDMVWEMKAIAGGTGITYEREVNDSINGFNLATIDSGTLYVHIS